MLPARSAPTRLRHAAALLPLLLALSLGAAPARAAAPPPPCWQSSAVSVAAGLPPSLTAALAGISPLVEEARARSNVPGITLAVMLDGAVVYVGGFGCVDLERGAPARPDSILRAGSISKLFTATMLFQLRDAGLLDLDRPVRDYVPEVWYRSPSGEEISPTFRQLASHTAGLPRSMQPPPATPEELFRRLHDVRATADPGSSFGYSNLGVAVLGQALAAIAGEPYDRHVARRILAPLGMSGSGFDPAALPPERRATGYRGVALAEDATVVASPAPPAALATMGPAGGLATTALDLLAFAALQWDGAPGGRAVLAPESVREMRWPVARTGGPASVGAGWFIRDLNGETLIMHNGSVDGFRADLRVLPARRLAVAVLYNQRPPRGQPFAGPEQLSRRILDALLPLLPSGAPQ